MLQKLTMQSWDQEQRHLQDQLNQVEGFFAGHFDQDDIAIIKCQYQIGLLKKNLEKSLKKVIAVTEKKNAVSGKNRYLLEAAARIVPKLQEYSERFTWGNNKILWLSLLRAKLTNVGGEFDFAFDRTNLEELTDKISKLDDTLKYLENYLLDLDRKKIGIEIINDNFATLETALNPVTANALNDRSLYSFALPLHKPDQLDRFCSLQIDYVEKAQGLIEDYHNYTITQQRVQDGLKYHRSQKLPPEATQNLLHQFRQLKNIKEQIQDTQAGLINIKIKSATPKIIPKVVQSP